MSDNTIDTEKTSEITKSDSETLIAQILKQQSEQNAALLKSNAEVLEAIKKMGDSNPVDHGTSAESKPKVEDASDVGDKENNSASYAPSGKDQASIIAPAGKPSGTDSVAKAEDEKEDKEKKEEKPVEKAEEIQKAATDSDGYKYEFVKAVRPKYGLLPQTPSNSPTGYQIIKAINSGFGGKYDTYEKSFIHAYENVISGAYGTGNPGGL